MARIKKEKKGEGTPAWLVTFSDLMTLLLTFFVLLMSMASLSKHTVIQINSFFSPRNFIMNQGAGRVSPRIQMIQNLLRDPTDIENRMQRIKDLLFPLDILPQEMKKSTLDKNLLLLQKPEGVVIVLTDKLLFELGQYKLSNEAKKMLSGLIEFMLSTASDVNVSGYTDNVGGTSLENFELSGRRALSVLEFFLENKLEPFRFSLSGYGSENPIVGNETEEGRAQNRRVEILLKTDSWIGAYP